MRFGVEYQLPSGSVGLTIFTATDLEAAWEFVEEMKTEYGHTDAFNLNPLPVCSIEELYRLFPRLASVTSRGRIARGGS